MSKKILLTLLFITAFFANTCVSAEKTKTSKVNVGIYIENINSISYSKNTSQIDFTVWFRWSDKQIHPNKTFKLKNARIDQRKVVFSGEVNNSKDHLEIIDISATFNQHWNIQDFPFDTQELKIQIEDDADDPYEQIIYVVDTKNIKPIKNKDITAWMVRSEKTFISATVLDSNYGNPDLLKSDRFTPQFNHIIEVEKKSELIGFKLLLAPIVAILLMAFVVLLPALESPRMGVPGTALFILVSSNFIVLNQLPESDGYSFAEKLISFGIIQSLIHLVVTVISIKYEKEGNSKVSIHIDHVLFVTVSIANIIFGFYTAYIISL